MPNFTKVAGFIPWIYIYYWQLSNCSYSSTIKTYPYVSRILLISFTQMLFYFLWQMPVYLVGDAKSVVWFKRPAMLLIRKDVDIIHFYHRWNFWKFKFHLNYFPRIAQFLDFYRLSVTIYTSLRSSQPKASRKKHRRTFSWSWERSNSKLLKWDWLHLLKTFGDPFCGFNAGNASLVFISFSHCMSGTSLRPTVKNTASTEFRVIRPTLCENCAFPQNLQKRKLGEIMVIYAVKIRNIFLNLIRGALRILSNDEAFSEKSFTR